MIMIVAAAATIMIPVTNWQVSDPDSDTDSNDSSVTPQVTGVVVSQSDHSGSWQCSESQAFFGPAPGPMVLLKRPQQTGPGCFGPVSETAWARAPPEPADSRRPSAGRVRPDRKHSVLPGFGPLGLYNGKIHYIHSFVLILTRNNGSQGCHVRLTRRPAHGPKCI